jgi:hypothetical protein
MKPEVPDELLRQAEQWDELHRWERRELGRKLRRLGLTYSEIRELIPVPKSTLAYWCRSVELTPEQIAAIRERGHSQTGVPRDTQPHRRREIAAVRASARRSAPRLLEEPLFAAGAALYWAEGAKSCNDLAIANTDPALLLVFIRWVRTYLDPNAEFRLSLHLHAGNDEGAAQQFWRRESSLPSARFTKTYVKPEGTGHRRNRLEHGVCRVRVCRSTDFWHMTMEWIDSVRQHMVSPVATLTPGR